MHVSYALRHQLFLHLIRFIRFEELSSVRFEAFPVIRPSNWGIIAQMISNVDV